MWDSIEDAFGELDKEEYFFFARTMGAYMRSLMAEGFTRREAFRLVESYSKFVYDMVIEEVMAEKDSKSNDDDDQDDRDLQ